MNLYGRVRLLNLRVEFTISDPVLLLGCDWCWFGSSEKDEFSISREQMQRFEGVTQSSSVRE